MAGPANFLLQQIAQGARFDGADRMYKGQQQGANMLADIQAQQTRNALAQAAPMLAQGNVQGAMQSLGNAGQFDPVYKLRADQQAAQLAQQKANQPMSAVGKLRSDLDAGRITPDEYKSGLQALQSRVGGFMTVSPGATVLDRTTGQPIYTSPGKAQKLSPTEFKAKRETEDNIINLEQLSGMLGQAKQLAPQALTGFAADTRATAGAYLPDWMVPDQLASPQAAQASIDLQKLLEPGALDVMAQTLKGATTDFELRKYVNLLADPNAPVQTKLATINRLEQLASKKLELERLRMQRDFGEGGQQPQQQSDIGTGNTADEQAAINAARDAISRGADPMLVRQRLEQNGVDPAVLD